MARRSRRSVDTDEDRDTSPVASPVPRLAPRFLLSEIEDRRAWHPERDDRPALNIFNEPHRLEVGEVRPARRSRASTSPPAGSLWSSLSHRLRFADAHLVVECVRRKQRREVLFAEKRVRSGRGGSKRRSWRSEIGC